MAKDMSSSGGFPILHQRVFKQGGLQYEVQQDFTIVAGGIKIYKGFKMREYTDGYFQVFNGRGDKHFVSLGPTLIAEYEDRKLITTI